MSSKTEPNNLVMWLRAQRNYTLALYADLPPSLWTPTEVPYLSHINPPLWELGHIAWFQEYFALRLPVALLVGEHRELPPSCSAFAEALLNSNTIAHRDRWTSAYPSRERLFAYMDEVLDLVCKALVCEAAEINAIDANIGLVLAHEFMHQEALTMTLTALGLPLPDCVPKREKLVESSGDLRFEGGAFFLGVGDEKSHSRMPFDNEMPPMKVTVAPFSISVNPLSGGVFEAFCASAAYENSENWSVEGNAWRLKNSRNNLNKMPENLAAIHINYFEAEAYCRANNRRLPTEAEWEFAAMRSPAFWASVGHVWEWTSSVFLPHPGFERGVYQEYSAPWFHTHQVLRGASFATHAVMKSPQYRNFYTKDRSDIFCGFRTCPV